MIIAKPIKSPRQVIHKAIKKHAGLSDFDDEGVAYEVEAILHALKCNGFKIVYTS
jgi:hypothetical protein